MTRQDLPYESGALVVAPPVLVVPVSALLISTVLGHVPTWNELVGTAMVIAALLLHTVGSAAAAKGVTAGRGADRLSAATAR